MQAAVVNMDEFLPPAKRAASASTLRAIGVASMDPMNHACLNALNLALDQVTLQFAPLETNAKSAFLIQSFRLAREWVKDQL